ncbi:MAG: AraC family transcriptional regulator [Sphaerochaeta sp.]|nr:AraC family transcriptional regulator [Sphaerochaeta sp.]
MAIKLIIADDEPLVLVGLQSMLPWAELGIEIVATAHNGRQLEEAIGREHPDLVITDIKMPIKSGLEVLKESSQAPGRSPLFILLTSYEEFSYVKEALSHQAVDYLVKLELTQQTLKDSVVKAIGILEERQGRLFEPQERSTMQGFRDKFFVRLFNGLIDSRQAFTMQSQELGIVFNESWYAVCYLEITPRSEQTDVSLYTGTLEMLKETLSRYLTNYVTSLDLHHLAVTLCLSEQQAAHYGSIIRTVMTQTVQVIYNYFSVDLRSSAGIPVDDPFRISESFLSARQLLASHTTEERILIAERQQPSSHTFTLEPFKGRLIRAFEELDGKELAHVIEDIASQLEEQAIGVLQAIEVASNILYLALTLLPDGQASIATAFAQEEGGYRQIYTSVSTDQCASYLRRLAASLNEQLQSRTQDYRAKIVANIQQYIKENIDRKLNLGEVALLFGFSQNYLSSMFSRYSGSSFVEYITDMKVAAAKELLAQGDLKIYEVADRLGFENSFYFSKVFKKVEGISPSQYLQHLQRRHT